MDRLLILTWTDRTLAGLIGLVVCGSVFSRGGAAWWWRPAFAAAIIVIALLTTTRCWIGGRVLVMRGAATFFAAFALALGAVQLAPAPAPIARLLSPAARRLHDTGARLELIKLEDPAAESPHFTASRSPATLDRSATLRKLVGGALCLLLAGAVARYVDRLQHLLMIWGFLITPFLITTLIVAVLLGGDRGGGGAAESSRLLATGSEMSETPGWTLWIASKPTSAEGSTETPWLVPVADREFGSGVLAAGPGGYLALASFGFPLALALVLDSFSPRGGRGGPLARLIDSSRGGLVMLVSFICLLAAILIGILAGPIACAPIVIGAAIATIPGGFASGSRRLGIGVFMAASAAIAAGLAIGWSFGKPPSRGLFASPDDTRRVVALWRDSTAILGDFLPTGVGVGGFPQVISLYKSDPLTPSTASSAVLQWGVETGLPGILLLLAFACSTVIAVPPAIRIVGRSDRCLAYGLIGAGTGLALFSIIHFSVEVAPVAIGASVLLGVWSRWSSGGSDIFSPLDYADIGADRAEPGRSSRLVQQ
jgi:hypothetical protein